MEKIYEGKNEKHDGKLTDNPKGLLILHVRCDGHRRVAVLNQREFEIKTLSNERPMFSPS